MNRIKVSENFQLWEFQCKDDSHQVVLKAELLVKLQRLRDLAGKPVRISLPNANEELQGEDVHSVMQQIITLNIFAPGGYYLTQAMGARIVTTDVHEYDFA